MSVKIYGIKNCDTMKKALRWLADHDIAYHFHDYKKAGVDKDMLEKWTAELGWETLINTSGTTFRKLPEQDKAGLDREKAVALMLAEPSMIKRPVLEDGDKLIVGFKPDTYQNELKAPGH